MDTLPGDIWYRNYCLPFHWGYFYIMYFVSLKSMVNVLKFRTPKFLTKWHMQTVQTQIRLLQSLIWVYTVCHSIKPFKRKLHKKQNWTKGPSGPYIPHLNHVIHSIANRDAILKVMVTLTMTFALRVIFWSKETSLLCLRVLVPSIAKL